MYLQWYEDGVKKSVYVKKADEEDIIYKVERRKELEKILKSSALNNEDTKLLSTKNAESMWHLSDIENVNIGSFYEMRVVMGSSLESMCKGVDKFGHRECFGLLDKFL